MKPSSRGLEETQYKGAMLKNCVQQIAVFHNVQVRPHTDILAKG